MRPVVIVGIGELGGLFARGLLRLGRTVIPVTRKSPKEELLEGVAGPELVLVTVAERDLDGVLRSLPASRRDRVGLVQNELLPRDWEAHGVRQPTVAVIWFEKKPGSEHRQILPTVLGGPCRQLLADALGELGIATRLVEGLHELTLELVLKNLYILTTNIAGIETGGTVGELSAKHRALLERVANEVLDIQAWRAGMELPRSELLRGLVRAIEADPAHACTGRSAPERLARAIAQASTAGIEVPELRRISSLVAPVDQS